MLMEILSVIVLHLVLQTVMSALIVETVEHEKHVQEMHVLMLPHITHINVILDEHDLRYEQVIVAVKIIIVV